MARLSTKPGPTTLRCITWGAAPAPKPPAHIHTGDYAKAEGRERLKLQPGSDEYPQLAMGSAGAGTKLRLRVAARCGLRSNLLTKDDFTPCVKLAANDGGYLEQEVA